MKLRALLLLLPFDAPPSRHNNRPSRRPSALRKCPLTGA